MASIYNLGTTAAQKIKKNPYAQVCAGEPVNKILDRKFPTDKGVACASKYIYVEFDKGCTGVVDVKEMLDTYGLEGICDPQDEISGVIDDFFVNNKKEHSAFFLVFTVQNTLKSYLVTMGGRPVMFNARESGEGEFLNKSGRCSVFVNKNSKEDYRLIAPGNNSGQYVIL